MSLGSEPDNVLFDWYARYVGEPTDERDVYAGFGLFLGGIALGLVGIVVFLTGEAVSGAGPAFAFREVAVVLAASGLPAALVGVVVLLPGDDRTTFVAVGGTAVCLVAVGLFVAAYPQAWNVRGADRSALGVGVYAVGLVATAAATGAALVGHQVERVALVAERDSRSEQGDRDESGGGGETVTDEQVREDIDEAMSNAELTWGGVEQTETKRLNFTTDTEAGDLQTNADRVTATETRDAGRDVDDAVSNLQRLQGRDTNTTSSEGTVDDQTAALTELKQRQRAEAEAEAEESADADGGDADGVLGRLRRLVGR